MTFGHQAGNGTPINERITFTTGGNLGIGTTSPSEKLTVLGNINAINGDLYTGTFNVVNAGGGIMSSTINVISDNFTSASNVDGDEDLYIGDDLQVNSQAYKPGGGSWSTASDKRLKKDISPFKDGLSHLLQIEPVTFKYNSIMDVFDKEKVHVGIIAQDVQQIAPYMVEEKPFFQKVVEDENGVETIVDPGTNYLTYDGSALTYILVNAVKEQQAQIELLNSDIVELERRLEELEISINKLTQKEPK